MIQPAERSSAFEPVLAARFLAAIGEGATLQYSAALVSLEVSTLRRWIVRGREATRGEYHDFCEAFGLARSAGQKAMSATLPSEVGRQSWRTVARKLERMFPHWRLPK
jgi:hypothetical protein